MKLRLVLLLLVSIPAFAEASEHWAFQPIRRPAVPRLGDHWVRNPIDAFVLRKLRQRQLRPSPSADRSTLIRRLYLDLTGLPPTWAAVKQWQADKRPDAYERLIDQLLASPRYGEQWGRHWLDIARYADSSGYESDKPREIWKYRDWVIRAINAGTPYDRFITEQLAGDLLPGATREQRIATGFHCNAMLDRGVRWESIIDRVETTGTVFLGLTLGCARCHTHKTDPVSHREFYQFFAFFNETQIVKLPLDRKRADGKPHTTLVLKHQPIRTHILTQGDPRRPGAVVRTGVPEFLPKLHTRGKTATRLDLARWLFDDRHPLTARVTANRIWQRFFSRALVPTEDDFGMQTAPPSHPDLLEYLASELRAGWNIKRIHRLILTSATYQQSSVLTRQLRQVDYTNRWLARQSRKRLSAETIRDVPLFVSGLIDLRIGGPSVFPDQPEGILNNRATPAKWIVSRGGDRFRRGMYTWVWRLTPHPHLPLFDSPDGVSACTRRHRTNNAVQALTMLNDPLFVQSARTLASKILSANKRSETKDSVRCQRLFQTCLSRRGSARELAILQRVVKRQRRELACEPKSVRLILGLDSKSPIDDQQVERAAWTVVCRIVLNMDETITRE